MFRYFVNNKTTDKFIIENKDHHHLKNVVRLKPLEEVECVYQGNVFLCSIDEISDDKTFVLIKNQHEAKQNKVKKVLIMSLIREQKWDIAIQKATELGVDEIVPITLKRNVVKIDPKKESNKIDRWQKICETAAMQAKRNTIPKVCNIVKNINELNDYLCDINLIAWEEEKSNSLKNLIVKKFNSIAFLIGPEGGIEQKEIELLKELNFLPISLGENILRAETAPLLILSALSYEGY